tara:strand:- start:203 stop:649 length:447 start_codon:yes stop_codon:yes gene_type:complete
MRITRQRLKNIILEEISVLEATDTLDIINTGDAQTANKSDMGDISEGEGMEMLQQAAQTLIDAGILGVQSPEELMMALKGLGKAALLPLAGVSMGTAAVAGKDALAAAMADDEAEEADMGLEEEKEGTLEELITQAIQEELAHLASKK